MKDQVHLLKVVAPNEGPEWVTCYWNPRDRKFDYVSFHREEDTARAEAHKMEYGFD